MSENVDRTKAFIDAYNRRDFDAAVASFAPDVAWVLPDHQRSRLVPRAGRGQAVLGGDR